MSLAGFLRDGFSAELVAPAVSAAVASEAKAQGVRLRNLGEHFLARTSSVAFVESWVRETVFSRHQKRWSEVKGDYDLVVNLSNCFMVRSDVWYLLGSVAEAIREIEPNLAPSMRITAAAIAPVLGALDSKQVASSAALSTIHVASSLACQRAYERRNVRVDRIIYPPLDTAKFRPTTPMPSEDYCLTYLGKELDVAPVVDLADAGIPIVGFGSKFKDLPRRLLEHPRVRVLGRVSDSQLVELYSHAKFLIFPFSAEPFGYVPIESMACGTPVLTYDRQGPGETVIHGDTGWKAADAHDLVARGVQVWRGGRIPAAMRDRCAKRSLEFSLARVGEAWASLMRSVRALGGEGAQRAMRDPPAEAPS